MGVSSRSRQPLFLGCFVLAGLVLLYLVSWWQKMDQEEQDRLIKADLQDQMDQMEMDALVARLKPTPPLPKRRKPGLMAKEQKGDIVGTKWHGGEFEGRPFLSDGRFWEFRNDGRIYFVERDARTGSVKEDPFATYNQEGDKIVISMDGLLGGGAELQRKTKLLSGKINDFQKGKEIPLNLEQIKE